MPKSVAMSCPLCLSVNDPADMLAVTMPHSSPPQTAPLHLCKRCTLEIMMAAVASELIDPREVFGDAPTSGSTDRAADSGVASDPAVAAVVLQDQRHQDDSPVDRREPEVPAGGAGSCEQCGKDVPADELIEWQPPGGGAMKLCSTCDLDMKQSFKAGRGAPLKARRRRS